MKRVMFVVMFLCAMLCGAWAKEFVLCQHEALAPQAVMMLSQDSLNVDEDDLLEVVESQASFPGGDSACWQWLKQHVRYPAECLENGVQGKVIVRFVVERDGSLSNIKVLQSSDERLSQEAVCVVGEMPKWIPAKQEIARIPKWADPAQYGDKFMRAYCYLPIRFLLPTTEVGEVMAKRDEENLALFGQAIDDMAVDSDRISAPVLCHDLVIGGKLKAAISQLPADQSGRIYDVTEQNASFPGGDEACYAWIKQNIQYPAACKENGVGGRVMVTFVVELDGSLSDAKVVRSPAQELSDEALRLIGQMPKWRPAILGDKIVRSRFNLPIIFRL